MTSMVPPQLTTNHQRIQPHPHHSPTPSDIIRPAAIISAIDFTAITTHHTTQRTTTEGNEPMGTSQKGTGQKRTVQKGMSQRERASSQ
jgi:hypothetical protein